MSNAGISIFGRPEGQVSISNGLFKELNLGSVMYLEGLTDGLILEEGESVGVIRQVVDSSGVSKGISIVGIIHYAKSYGQDRPGGFVGAAICFKGMPHPVTINKLLLSLSLASQKLIDPNSKKFLTADEKDWSIKLPDPNDNWVHNVPGLNQIPQKEKARLVVEIDGSLYNTLLSVVQGVLSNPEYNKYETTIITEKNSFLDRAKAKGYKTVTLFDLFNYSGLLGAANKQLNDTKEKTNKLIDEFKPTLTTLKTDIENAKTQLANIQSQIGSNKQQLASINSRLSLETNNLEALKLEQSKLANFNQSQAQNIIQESDAVRKEIDKIVNHDRQKNKQQQSHRDSKYEKIEKGTMNALFAKTPIFFGFGALMLIIGMSISYFLFNGGTESENVGAVGQTKEENTKDKVPSIVISYPDISVMKDSLEKNAAIKEFITSNYKKFSNLDSIKENDLEKSYFLIPINEEIKSKLILDSVDFETPNRVKILKHYLSLDGNIYQKLNLDTSQVTEESAILGHFIWVVYYNSSYKEHKDKHLEPTNKMVHVVPLIKE